MRADGDALREPVPSASGIARRAVADDGRAFSHTRDLLSAVLDGATEQTVIATDDTGRITLFNRGASQLLGYTAAEMLGETLDRLFDPEQLAQRAQELGVSKPIEAILAPTADGEPDTRHWCYLHKDGSPRPVSQTVTRMQIGRDGPTGYVAMATDVRDQIRAEAAMRDSEQRFRLAFDNAPIGMCLTDLGAEHRGQFMKVNRAMCDMLGYTAEELCRATVFTLSHEEDAPLIQIMLDRAVAGEINTWTVQKRYIHADGHDIWALLSTCAVSDDDGKPSYLVSQLEDITARRQMEAELSHRALHDPLTGLANRVLLHDHLAAALLRARDTGTRVAVLFLDLDHFKHVNDALGHDVGDRVLISVANCLRVCLRPQDIAARLGGDEFVVVCEGMRTSREATKAADRIMDALAGERSVGERPVRVSTGIALGDADTIPGQLLREADSAMYRAKRNGRARWEMADPELRASGLRRIDLETELHTALQEKQFLVHYQPSYDMRTGAIIGAEALLRWDHPTRGLLRAGEFIDVAEESELIVPLGEWVLRQACERAAGWQRATGGAGPDVWVNLSARQLEKGDFHTRVAGALAASELDPGRLCLELTERQLLGTTPSATTDFQALSRMGVSLAIDDFGTGYSGLSYLRRMRFAMLKLDRSFVAGVPSDPTDTALTASVIALSRSLQLRLVCEGVESAAQRNHLLQMGCDLGQGDWLHPPAGADVVDVAIAQGVPSGKRALA